MDPERFYPVKAGLKAVGKGILKSLAELEHMFVLYRFGI